MAIKSEVQADDGRAVRLVQCEAADKPEALAAALGIAGVGAVVVLAGGDNEADEVLRPRLVQLVGRGLVRAARDANALCITRGGAGGVASLVGRAVADIDNPPPLLGVAPALQLRMPGQPAEGDDARQPLTPGLSHLLLTAGAEWGAELRSKIEVAQALAAGKPVMMVVIGGGAGTAAEVLQAVRRRWAVLLVKRSGGAADDLARQWEAREADHDDPVVAEILADGNLTCITLGEKVGDAVETLARQVLRQSGGESVLRQAWRRFGAIDSAAVRQQTDFMDAQWRILALGVLAVFLAIVHLLLRDAGVEGSPGTAGTAGTPGTAEITAAGLLYKALGYILIALPIGTSVLIAATNRFKPGKRWILLRSAAESIKREIYRYRLRSDAYGSDATREKNLSKTIEDITRRLARTEANTTALPVYTGPIPPVNAASARDDGLSFLGTDQYVRMRLEDQLAFYRRKTVALEAQLQRLQYAVLGAGAAGTLLAALGDSWVIWITLTTALGAAFMSFLSYRQTETTLVGYNQTATDLDNLLSWWTSLQPEEQSLRDNVEALASHTEQVLSDELAGWTERMTDALEKLRPKDQSDEPAAPVAAPTPGAPAAAVAVAALAPAPEDAVASAATEAAATETAATETAAEPSVDEATPPGTDSASAPAAVDPASTPADEAGAVKKP